MQIVNKKKICSECGCISFPDSKSCPKCGNLLVARQKLNQADIKSDDLMEQFIYLYNQINNSNASITIDKEIHISVRVSAQY